MKNHADKLIALATLAVVGLMAYGLFVAVRWVFLGVIGLDEKLSAAIIAACTTVFVSVATVVYTQQKTKSREIDNSHRPQKMEIYKRFMDKAVVGLLKASKEKKFETPEFQKELEELFFTFTADVIVWGSPAVIRAYTAFRNTGANPDIVLRIDDLMQAMRKDLGNSNWTLNRGDLIKLFITDPEKLDALMNPTKKS
jgi:hypothetical protein